MDCLRAAVFSALLLVPGLAHAQEPLPVNPKPFGLWLQEFKAEAVQKGIKPATLDEAFASTQPIGRIVELDRKQPEGRTTLSQYLASAVTSGRIATGRQLLAEHRELLDTVSSRYGVQPEFIVALWGIETSFGTHTGDFSVVDSLATLAYDGRRSEYFRKQLLIALKIIQEEEILSSDMIGSWAGAMGQCQFMPESFERFSVDFDGDGHRDIWNTQGDVFASMANYLTSEGWKGDEGWGFAARLPEGFDKTQADINKGRSLSELQKMGVRREGGNDLPQTDQEAFLIMVGEGDAAAPYVIYGNYKVLLKWNRSRYFATAVSTLAEAIAR